MDPFTGGQLPHRTSDGEAVFDHRFARGDPHLDLVLAQAEDVAQELVAQADADERWHYYQQLAGIERTVPHVDRRDPGIIPDVESDAGGPRVDEGAEA